MFCNIAITELYPPMTESCDVCEDIKALTHFDRETSQAVCTECAWACAYMDNVLNSTEGYCRPSIGLIKARS